MPAGALDTTPSILQFEFLSQVAAGIVTLVHCMLICTAVFKFKH